jgi:ribonucleoside-diphosphate reductase alpha chain
MFTKEEVYNATLEYFNGDDMRTSIWMDKYALKDNNKFLEKTPDDMHKRLAKEFARIEQKYPNPLKYEEILSLLEGFRWIIPAGSILYGVGNPFSISSLGNCFVIGNSYDSIGGILSIDQEQAQLMKRRAGVGHDISHLRPALTPVTNAAGTTSGAVSFMDRFSHTTREIGQNNRRGALMLTMDINHPDIEQFITSKDDLTKITGANISVKITDEFMKAVENDEDFLLEFWIDKPPIIDGIEMPSKGYKILKTIKAKALWDKLIHQAWKSAEPGVLFWDKIKSESIPSCYGKEWEETSTNP